MHHQLILEILSLLRHPWQLVSLACSAVTMMLLLHFGMPAAADSSAATPAFLLGVLVITLTNLTQSAFTEDAREGRIAHWHTSRFSLEWMVACKFLAYLLCTGIPMGALFTFLAANGDFSSLTNTARILLLTVTAIIACGLLSGALSICFASNQLMAYLLTLPFLFSIVIFAAPALAGSKVDATLLLATALLLTPVGIFLTARLLRLCH
jgi:ABC-type transport system involved in cytochrome c biogenesis permease component